MTPHRRQFLNDASILSGLAFLSGLSPSIALSNSEKQKSLLGFTALPASSEDALIVPDGYQARVLISWGDALFTDSPKFLENGDNTAADQTKQFGDNNDGMMLFPLAENRFLLAVNHEYPNHQYLLASQNERATNLAEVQKSQAAMGVSVLDVQQIQGHWQINQSSAYNRRITANTVMQLSGPAAQSELLKTQADTDASQIHGTLNNCAAGKTPWGTYLTCEENFDDFFGSTDAKFELTDAMKTYGIKTSSEYGWEQFDARFDISREPNEANRFGWIVEINPHDPQSTPVKHTALGRFKHENAELTLTTDQRVAIYMGDDEKGQYIYKYLSKAKFNPENKLNNSQLLADGTLLVARFDAGTKPNKGKGKWLPLVYGENGLDASNGFHSQADVLINARRAAKIVGATDMDRPEWISINPKTKTVYCTLTNNSDRGKKFPLNAANPRENNIYGHIIRWNEAGQDAGAMHFDWDIYLLGGNPDVYEAANPRHGNVSSQNMFNSPDGIGFDGDGRLWIQTDGKYSNKDEYINQGNNMMLAGDPQTGELKRFLTGPKSCEITGLAFTPDYKTLLVNVQHPGEKGDSRFPNNSERPRSSVIVIQKNDGGVIGS